VKPGSAEFIRANRKVKELDRDCFVKYSELSPSRERCQVLWRMEWDFGGETRVSTALIASGPTWAWALEQAFNWAQDPPQKRRAIFREALMDDVKAMAHAALESGKRDAHKHFGVAPEDFERWSAQVKQNNEKLDADLAPEPKPGDIWAASKDGPSNRATVKHVINGVVVAEMLDVVQGLLGLMEFPIQLFRMSYPYLVGDIRLPEGFEPITKEKVGSPSEDMRAEWRKEFGAGD
jgi:hypothetical protein